MQHWNFTSGGAVALSSPLDRVALPLVAAPMTDVSGPDLVTAACSAGVIGSFPTHNARSVTELDLWLTQITAGIQDEGPEAAPFAANLVVHRSNERLQEDVACLIRHGTPLVITSVGSPVPVLGPLHEAGCQVFADVASLRHVERAIEAGVDGLVLLTAGAGGQTGWANPLSFVRAVRECFDGPLVLAGGVSDGAALWAAQVLGADLAYMGTKFIATAESLADDAFRAALVESTLDDVTLSTALSGLPANFLNGWLESALEDAAASAPAGFAQSRLLSRRNVWSAGHSVSGITEVVTVDELVHRTRREYEQARQATATALKESAIFAEPGR
ncbi:NAD(P)H-dependent flavin oxidoreductase [Actinomadura sp. 9N407]|uniref:NAD(P)H-dependent flavin oxidoreductase n=1 Tax=Actinomadura sp. 9N407 TaxID=3375154 RepID=UPI0037AE1100